MKHSILKTLFLFSVLAFLTSPVTAQSLKEKMQAQKDKLANKMQKDNSEAYQCGHVHVESLAEKANPMKALQKSLGGAVTDGSNPDLGTAAISFYYQANLHPQFVMKYPTKTPGWETCGDAVFAGFTNRDGTGLSSTDGKIMMGDVEVPFAGIGTYFAGFKPNERGTKKMIVSSSDGDKVEFDLEPGMSLAIKTIDGKTKGEEVVIDGTKDIVIELADGDADPTSRLHVQMVCKLVGTPILYDVIVTKANNTITIPKEAFKNFEGSPSPFIKNNILIVNRVSENVINGTDAGAFRTLSAYMDWAPVSVAGDLSKGNVLTMGFDTTKNTQIRIDLKTDGEYNFTVSKAGPYTSPPVKVMKNVAVASFVVRGNLSDKQTSTSSAGSLSWTTETTKWFPEISDASWQQLVEKMYAEFEKQVETDLSVNILPLSDVTSAKAYKYAKPIQDGATKNKVEVGAGDTKRILTTSGDDLFKDLSITFPGDFVSERLVNELGVDAVLAVTVDLDFNFESEGLDPRIKIVAFAPNVSYKTAAQYFSINANTRSKSLKDARNFSGGAANQIYSMIKADEFIKGFSNTLSQLSEKEDEYPVYEKLWRAKL